MSKPANKPGLTDITGSRTGPTLKAEARVSRFYERAPYPDLGAKPKNPGHWLDPVRRRLEITGERAFHYLDAGCGTGHSVVGVALAQPDWRISAIDLSEPSLAIARALADRHSVSIDFNQGSYLDPLPFDGRFDLIGTFGSVHHTPDPPGAVHNLLAHLTADGLLVMHLYGRDLDRGKFVIREILDIVEPDLSAIDRRFALYRELVAHRRPSMLKRFLDLSPRVALRAVRDAFYKARRRRGESWSPPWTDEYRHPTGPWIDHFCHPLENVYNVRDVQKLAEEAGLEVLEMLGQGRETLSRLPQGWRDDFAGMDYWDRARLMELLDVTARSVLVIGRRAPVL